jgi:nucleotide-binding universal stress UspA family protein
MEQNWAIGLALKLHSEVVVVSVVKPPEFSSSIDEVDEFYAEGENYYRPILAKVIEDGEKQGISLKIEILHGHPAESLVRYAADYKADLIVMGTRGMGGFKNLVIGSVAQKVTTYATVPVTIIKK